MNCPHCNQPINLGHELGKLKSEAKARASRENGRKGGKPKLDRPPCECGKPARWRGPENGLRQYYCDECYCQFHTRFYVQSEQVRGERRRYWIVDKTLQHEKFTHGRVSELTTNKRQAYWNCANFNEKDQCLMFL